MKPVFPLVGLGSLLFGVFLCFFPNLFVTYLMYVFGFLMVVAGINQIWNLFRLRRLIPFRWYVLLAALVILGLGVFVLLKPMASASLPFILLGVTFILYGISELVNGVRWRKCENFDECGYYEEEEVPSLGHDRGGWVTVKAATCTAEGEQARECRVCGDVERRTVDELGHDYVASEAAGGTEYVCVRCGDGYFLPGAEQEGAGAVYALSADGLSYIVTGAERGAAEIAIPDEHLGLPVTEIADGAFEGNTAITRATLGGNIARIGERAFYGCSSLLCVNVPESAEYMGEGAFGHCVALESVRYDAADIAECYNVFPNAGTEGGGLTLRVGAAVKRIPANLFYAPNGTAPGLEEVLFDEGSALEEIGDGAFSGCARLGRICLPASVARIGVEAFYGCSSLEYARVPAAATVCSGAFADVSDAFDCVLF